MFYNPFIKYTGLSVECYDGQFVPMDYPDYGACKDPKSCSVSQLDNFSPNPPSHLALLSGTPVTVPHLGVVHFICANGKTLTEDIDPVTMIH